MSKINVDKYVYEVAVDATNPNGVPVRMGLSKGDILVYRGESDLVRLPVGTNGQVLMADSTAELGVKWATLS